MKSKVFYDNQNDYLYGRLHAVLTIFQLYVLYTEFNGDTCFF